jgi:membrane protease YdiL (CAAX protease family)
MDPEAEYPSPAETPPASAQEGHPENTGGARDTVTSLDLRESALPPWNWSDIVLIAVTAAFSSFLAMSAFYFIRARGSGRDLKALASNVWVLVPAQIVGYAITFLLMYLLVTRLYHLPFWRGIKWIWPPAIYTLLFPFIGAALALGLGLLQRLLPMPQHVPFDRLFTTVAAIHLMAVFGILVAPFMEELFFRGFLFPVLERWGKPVAILGTAAAFAVVHGGQYGWAWSAVLLMFLVGLTLTIARAWTGSVAPGFLIHMGYNLTLFAVMYLATDQFRHLDRL